MGGAWVSLQCPGNWWMSLCERQEGFTLYCSPESSLTTPGFNAFCSSHARPSGVVPARAPETVASVKNSNLNMFVVDCVWVFARLLAGCAGPRETSFSCDCSSTYPWQRQRQHSSMQQPHNPFQNPPQLRRLPPMKYDAKQHVDQLVAKVTTVKSSSTFCLHHTPSHSRAAAQRFWSLSLDVAVW